MRRACRNHYFLSQILHRFLTCSLQISSCYCCEYACAEQLATIITYRLRFFTDSILTCSLQISSCDCGEYACVELAAIITFISDSSPVLVIFTVQISSCDCGEYACAELAAIITYHLRFLTCSLQISSCDCGEYACAELAASATPPGRIRRDTRRRPCASTLIM